MSGAPFTLLDYRGQQVLGLELPTGSTPLTGRWQGLTLVLQLSRGQPVCILQGLPASLRQQSLQRGGLLVGQVRRGLLGGAKWVPVTVD